MIRYWLRRLYLFVFTFDLPCASKRCGRPTVGISAWCRGHTDAILFHGITPSRDRETPLYVLTDSEAAKWGKR